MEKQREQQRQRTLEEGRQSLGRQTAQTAKANICPHCGTVNEAESLFCEECGTPLGQGRLCPQCHQPLDPLADYCERCKSYVCATRCSFCGAEVSSGDAFCPECGGNLREGIICPACHTRSPFSYCRVCGMPLTEEAKRQSLLAREEPMWRQMTELADEVESLMRVIPIDTPRQTDLAQCNEELCRRVRDLLGREVPPDVTMRLGETSDAIAARLAAKRHELQQMLDAVAAQPQENPVATRNYVMARKPASARIGWKCNYKQVVHSGPCGCACPQLGGKWVVITPDTKMEEDL